MHHLSSGARLQLSLQLVCMIRVGITVSNESVHFIVKHLEKYKHNYTLNIRI